jgi:hypothetical protein
MSRGALCRLLAAGAIGGLALIAVVMFSSAAASLERVSWQASQSEGRILPIAETAAARAGEPKPTLIQHSEGTRHKANLVDSGDGVPGQQWST